jgi:multisubunit Na+/H+ antiporter MnhE subunit
MTSVVPITLYLLPIHQIAKSNSAVANLVLSPDSMTPVIAVSVKMMLSVLILQMLPTSWPIS